jgi:hypothetical protein
VATKGKKKGKNRNRNQQKKRPPQQHLPKVGTPEDDAYLQRRSREDLVDFGMTPRKRGPMNIVIVVGVLVLLGLGVAGLLFLTHA